MRAGRRLADLLSHRTMRRSLSVDHLVPGNSWPEVLAVFLRLGLTSFGGPIAHLGYFNREYVQKRRISVIIDRIYASPTLREIIMDSPNVGRSRSICDHLRCFGFDGRALPFKSLIECFPCDFLFGWRPRDMLNESFSRVHTITLREETDSGVSDLGQNAEIIIRKPL